MNELKQPGTFTCVGTELVGKEQYGEGILCASIIQGFYQNYMLDGIRFARL